MAAFFIPLIIGSSLSPASPPVVSMALPCVMLIVCLPLLITGLLPEKIRLPFRVSTLPLGEPIPPYAYTLVEDVVAVDGGGLTDFRRAWKDRYEASAVMRKIIRDVSLGWGITGCAFAIGFIVISWTTTDDIAIGIGYGLPWLWAAFCSWITVWWVKKEMAREYAEWTSPTVHRETSLHIVESRIEGGGTHPAESSARHSIGRRRSTSVA